jgi:hypothetical protein
MLPDQLKNYFRRFVNQALVITVILAAIYAIALVYAPPQFLSPAIPLIIIFFLVLTLSIFHLQLKASVNRLSKFVNVFLMATGLKLLGFLVIIGVYSFFNKADAVNFIISFFLVYLVFTIFEIVQLLNVQKLLNANK